ncbi:hypothetical protein F4780DRAFT_796577 [Xylariomycetidae sp. FL0641]|nr:hypothetical protein F4780DRAFT_796577 [Xylariomycetidae sp. FL0641]
MTFKSLGRQTWAIVKKNLVVAAVRKWFSTTIRCLVVPIILVVLILEIPNFAQHHNKYGVGKPHPIRSLADSMQTTSKSLVLVHNESLGLDFPPVLERITKSLDQNRVIHLENPDQLNTTCPVDYHGTSPCHAAIVFDDAPSSGLTNASWNYTIRTDPSYTMGAFNVYDTNSVEDRIFLPLQLTVENAIGNTSTRPEAMAFTTDTQEAMEIFWKQSYQSNILATLSFVFFFSMVPVGHQLAGMMASDRESGVSQLIDAMGGGGAWPRVFGYVISFDLLYLPLWIILGALFSSLLLDGQNAAIVIFWQIFTGWSVTSASAFGASFFKKSAFASILVGFIPVALAAVATHLENQGPALSSGAIAILSLLWPSMNYVFFLNALVKFQIAGIPFDFQPFPLSALPAMVWSEAEDNWINDAGPYFLWIVLWVQIIGYALLAVLVETILYGNNRRRRYFTSSTEDSDAHVAIETTKLVKQYGPSWLQRWFCCAKSPPFKAVDGLDLVSHRHQILCLLGPNGSGKTTTLGMLAGFQAPTDGSVRINAMPSQLGICPQRDVMWDDLTVYEHLSFWNTVKGNTEDAASLEQLILRCDLVHKRNSTAKSLSGGMKRKLQLACMLVGGSSICLMDEVTSGLDPISRRVIWNVILSERSRRTIVMTTHFLDECEVLSDHVVIITLGKMKCQGTPAELKNEYGGGYRVHIPKSEDVSTIAYPLEERRDRYICRTPDTASAARLLASLKHSRDSELYITGPTIEDVFLKVAEDPHALAHETADDISISDAQPQRTSERDISLSAFALHSRQIRALWLKKLLLLRSTWWAYVLAVVLPIVVTHFIAGILDDYTVPQCDALTSSFVFDYPIRVSGLDNTVVGPPAFGDRLTEINATLGGIDFEVGHVESSRADFESFIRANHSDLRSGGGLWAPNDSTPLLAYAADSYDHEAGGLLNLLNEARSGMPIYGSRKELTAYYKADGGGTIFYVVIFCVVQAIYPAFFALYPAYERQSRVRALQYSNGVRPFSLLWAYWMFDFASVLVVSIACTAVIAGVVPWFGIGHIFLVQALYGLAATLFAYLVSMMARSQSSALAFSMLFMVIMFIISVIAMVGVGSDTRSTQAALDGTAFGLGLIFPIQNLLRSLSVGLNTYIVRCRGSTMVTYPGSIYAHGGPILLLILQNIALFSLLLGLEGGSFSWFKRRADGSVDGEKTALLSGRDDVDAETSRVASSGSDLLRVVHASKKFGSSLVVDNVSLGLQEGEILALLGPNGAGKTTMINMIRGELTPSSGTIYLEGIDVQKNKRLAQTHLGVCPQFDALDMLTVRQHLTFYARCKGVKDIKADVDWVVGRVGLRAHVSKLAAKLSGGNKRKLSLAIALLGNPPVLVLDEPSSAMDAASKRVLWRTLAAVAPGRSVLLTTHSMEEADALATRAAILARRLLAIGSTEQLRKRHSNEYHVHLILRSAPLSSPEEMQRVADWVQATLPGVRFEGRHLGGQVRFVVPADSKVPGARDAVAGDDTIAPASGPVARRDVKATQSFTRYLIETLEARKAELGVDCYSISAATMESVFLRVVKESDAEEDERVEKKPWWKW